VVRFRLWLATALALGAIVGSVLRAQVSEEEKSRRDESGKKQHETSVVSSPTPEKSPSAVPKAKAAAKKSKKKRSPSATPEESPPIRKAKLATEESTSETAASRRPQESPHPAAKQNSAKDSGEEEITPKPKPSETPEPTAASRKSKKSASPTPKPKTAKKKSRRKEPSSEPKKAARAKAAAKEEETPRPEKTPRPHLEESPAGSETATAPRAIAVPTPAALPSPQSKIPRAVPAEERAQVVIEKSGLEEDQGFEPPPSPPPRRFGFWPWSRSRPSSYRYLSRSVIEAIRRAPVKRRRWQFIVVHNSGTRQGNARVFDYYHRHVRRMQNGLAYHFVIGNGTSTGNGQIEVGDRWRRQINGGHVHSDYLNNISLGICLVGDFNRDQPTRAQLESCEELIRYLRERCGKTDRGDIPVRPHREMNPPRWATDCPGDAFPYSWFRRF
jgi:N-acetylmuramoyl-L-alanine amidase-like protein